MASSECVNKALRILQRLGDAGSDGIALTRIAEGLDLPKASVHRALVTLGRRGFAKKNDFGKYMLGAAYLDVPADPPSGYQAMLRAGEPWSGYSRR